jgi:hypothetical protein
VNINKILVGGIFCDLKKAFDCVNHDILLSKLEFYGIVGKAYALLKSYLKDRYQRVLIDNCIIPLNGAKLIMGSLRDQYWDLYCLFFT